VVVREIPVADTRPLRHAVLRPNEPLEDLIAHEPDAAFAVGAFEHDQLLAIGFVSADGQLPRGHTAGAWRVRGMATAEYARGRGLGAAVLDALVRHAVDAGATRVWCNARTPARSFYERAGFRVSSDEFEIRGIGPHYVMERAVGDASDDRAQRTPFPSS
jgi:ribosomal protein S18 acetylase RimI-like enzyme